LATLFVCGLWSSYSAIKVRWAAFQLSFAPIEAQALESFEVRQEIRQKTQSHFLSYDVYIPQEDIIVVSKQDYDHNGELVRMMFQACGQGTVYVWIPLIFKLPYFGHIVLERCWNPKIEILN
jgi:hypothetical protein